MSVDSAPHLTSLPLIDISRFGGPDREAFLDELRYAAHEVGFFYVVGHGIDRSVTDAVFATAREFFALPVEQRLEIENVNSPYFRGYTRVGTEVTAGAADQRDQLDFGPDRPPRTLGPDDPPYLRLIGPNQWTDRVPALKPAVLQWINEADRVSRTVLRALAAALGQPDAHFDTWFDDEAWPSAKVSRYPGRGALASRQGVGSHKDYGYLALVLQDDLRGLEVLGPDGSWIAATPVEGALVFNIGEALEIVTRGYLKATVHRVVSPPADRDRYSAPFFLGPRLDAVVEPITLPPDLAVRARGVDRDPANPLFAEYGRKMLHGQLRSHPRVAQRWYADLTDTLSATQNVGTA